MTDVDYLNWLKRFVRPSLLARIVVYLFSRFCLNDTESVLGLRFAFVRIVDNLTPDDISEMPELRQHRLQELSDLTNLNMGTVDGCVRTFAMMRQIVEAKERTD